MFLIFFCLFIAALDKGDDRRLGRKPVLTSSQVHFQHGAGANENTMQIYYSTMQNSCLLVEAIFKRK